ncbi:MAG: sodium:calcium antiporter [Hyphomicrobiaceae bacterium]
MIWTYVALLAGVVAAAVGGELFVRGTVGLARAARLSPGIIAASVAAFATSSPELTVAVTAAASGEPEISLGDALGSNVCHGCVVLGAALLIARLLAPRGSVRRDFAGDLIVPFALAARIADGELSRIDGLLLLGCFVVWLGAVLIEVRNQRSAAGEVLGDANPKRAAVEGGIGLVLLIVAGKLIVVGATGIAKAFGLSEFVIGATVVAIGTSIPELATALIARIRGHDEVGLGTILGSNIYNGLFIVGIAAVISPIHVPIASAAPALLLGVASVALCFPTRNGRIDRWRGGILLAVYMVYLAAVLQTA